MGTSDSHVHPGGPSTNTKAHKTLTTTDPSWERKVADFADAGIRSMREPAQSRRTVRIEPMAEQVADQAADVISRLVASASKHRPESAEPTESDRVLKLIIDEVFDGEYGSSRIESLIRRSAVEAVARWIHREALAGAEQAEPQEAGGLEEFLADPLAVVAPDLLDSDEPLQGLVDEFLAELLVELVQAVGGEAMFPGLSTLKLLWALYRWAVDRLLGSRARRRRVARSGAEQGSPATEQELLDELLDLDGRTEPITGEIEPGGLERG
jgi:hypothetical protein